MLNRFILILLLLFCAGAMQAQNPYIQGNVQGGTGVPGTKSRNPLNSLERAANNLPGATILTDTFGNQRFALFVYISDTCLTSAPPLSGNTANLNSFIQVCGTDSTFYIDWTGAAVFTGAGGASSVNWYNSNDTTTDATRTAYILQNAEWLGVDPNGYISMVMGDVSVGQLYLDATESSLSHNDVAGNEIIRAVTDGIELTTSTSASRAVDITTDTVNLIGSFDATNFRMNFLSDTSYLYADSAQVLGLGQFPSLPNLAADGTDKGFFYKPGPGSQLVGLYNGSGTTGQRSSVELLNSDIQALVTYVLPGYDYSNNGVNISPSSISETVAEQNSQSFYDQTASVDTDLVKWTLRLNDHVDFGDTASFLQVYQVGQSGKDAGYSALGYGPLTAGGAIVNVAYIGKASPQSSEMNVQSPRLAFGIQQNAPGGTGGVFDWLKIDLYDYDTTRNAIQFYNDRYRWKNAYPSPTVGDTSLHYWAGDGTGTVPGFMTLDDVCAHCSSSAVNWYNSNGFTTDNTRIATVTETATWLSEDVVSDGVYPFRFELTGSSPNEPEMMDFQFPGGDSLTLGQSDVEIVWHTNTDLSNWADGIYSMRADSAYFTSNLLGGTGWKVTDNEIQNNAQRITQTIGVYRKQDVIEVASITGTAQTELTMPTTGSVLNLPSNSAANFEVHITAVCSAAGNGIGISTGEAWASWHLGGIKNIAGTTALVGTVQAPATAQNDTGMSASVVTIDANDTNDSLRLRFTPPSTAGTTTVIKVVATIDFTQTSY